MAEPTYPSPVPVRVAYDSGIDFYPGVSNCLFLEQDLRLCSLYFSLEAMPAEFSLPSYTTMSGKAPFSTDTVYLTWVMEKVQIQSANQGRCR